MKLTALILATYICLLSVQSAVTQIYSALTKQPQKICGHKCCKHDAGKQNGEQESNTCYPNGTCNPFEHFKHCSCCFGYNLYQQAFDFIALMVSNEYISAI